MNEVERLTLRAKEIQAELAKDRERNKKKPNERMDEDIPEFIASYDFWCDVCQEDFTAPARKSGYTLDGNKISTIRGRCPHCETTAIRNATHRDRDRYYHKSLKIRKQRNEYALDLLQAGQFGFKTHYGAPYKEFTEKLIIEDENKFNKRRATGLKGLSLNE